jgi:hypothetical protein
VLAGAALLIGSSPVSGTEMVFGVAVGIPVFITGGQITSPDDGHGKTRA